MSKCRLFVYALIIPLWKDLLLLVNSNNGEIIVALERPNRLLLLVWGSGRAKRLI